MKIVVVGGGTGGHIVPAVAVVKEILSLKPETEVEFWTDFKNYEKVRRIFEEFELETSLKEQTVKRESEEKVGRKKVVRRQRFKRRDVVEGQEVAVRRVLAGKFRRYAGWKMEDYFTHFGILVRDVIIKNFINVFLFGFGVLQSLVRLIPVEGRPDVIFLKGGFVGLPTGLVAGWLKIPYVVHESDATPGLANRILRKKATVFATGVQTSDDGAGSFVGIPIAEEFEKVSEAGRRKLKEELGFEVAAERPVTLFLGGSQGSVHLNEAVLAVLPELLRETQVGIVTGEKNYKDFVEKARGALGVKSGFSEVVAEKVERGEALVAAEAPSKTEVKICEGLLVWNYCKEIWKLIGAADLVVSRAGATTIAELAAMEKATVLVPFEALPGGHQAKNAKLLEKAGVVKVVLDEEMVDEPTKLLRMVKDLAKDEEARKALEEGIKKTGKRGAAKALAEVIVGVGSGEAKGREA